MANASWFVEPTANDTGGYYEFFRYISSATDGLFWPMMLLVIWMVTFVSMLASGNLIRVNAAKAWVFASFFTVFLAIPLAVLDYIANKYMYIPIVMLGIGVIWLIVDGVGE